MRARPPDCCRRTSVRSPLPARAPLPPQVIMEEFEGEMRADRRDISTRAARYMKFAAVLAAVALVAGSGLLPEPDHH